MNYKLSKLIEDCSEEIDDLIERSSALNNSFDESVKYFTFYALIKVCGTCEYVFHSIIIDHFSHSLNNSKISRYLSSSIGRSSLSVTYDNMIKLLTKFDDDWTQQFKNSVHTNSEGSKLCSSASSLVNSRHAFAHGQPCSITLSSIKSYFEDIKVLLNYLDKVVNQDEKKDSHS